MKNRSICIVQGHPDPGRPHLCHALADAYADGAKQAGHVVSEIRVADLAFDYLRSAEDFEAPPPPDVAREREKLAAAGHVAFFFPLWMGGMPALLRGFIEHCARGGFLLDESGGPNEWPAQRMKGKSARLVVTMGMPAFLFRWFFHAHGIRGVERNVLGMSGFRPVRHTFLGAVESVGDARRRAWIEAMRRLGARAR